MEIKDLQEELRDISQQVLKKWCLKALEKFLFNYTNNSNPNFLQKGVIQSFLSEISWKDAVNLSFSILANYFYQLPGEDAEKSVAHVLSNLPKYLRKNHE